jgi:alpha-D-ribose 1-methylphosphonate 5-triphosphate synthase subunit PhnG
MFQPVDALASAAPSSEAGSSSSTASALALLARAPLDTLEARLAGWPVPAWTWLRAPEIGLMMLRGRIGGDGQAFNLGEVTVTRCAIRLDDGQAGHVLGVGYVMGRSTRHATLVALHHALLQTPFRAARGEMLLAELAAHAEAQRSRVAEAADATRVAFATLARESNA